MGRTNLPDPAAFAHVARNVRLLRIDRGWTQRELGARVERTQQEISQLERGVQPSANDVRAFSRALGVTARTLTKPLFGAQR